MMRLIFEALFFRAARIWSREGGTKSLANKDRDRQLMTPLFYAKFSKLFFYGTGASSRVVGWDSGLSPAVVPSLNHPLAILPVPRRNR
jgi:hypothetical protein